MSEKRAPTGHLVCKKYLGDGDLGDTFGISLEINPSAKISKGQTTGTTRGCPTEDGSKKLTGRDILTF